MDLNSYQFHALSTALYPANEKITYPTLGLVGEAGEVAEKVKKWKRDGKLDVQATAKELGDVLWYLAVLANDLGFKFSDIAEMNLAKLQDRANRGVLQGSGDNR